MSSQIESIQLTDPDDWHSKFSKAGIDFIPDPMILRAAELFILGKSGSADADLGTADEVWSTIKKNIDGILAFFHALMTRERIPLIDYKRTFPSQQFDQILGSLVVPVHPNYTVYQDIKTEAQQKLKNIDFNKLPAAMIADISDELGSLGYEWYPNPDLDLPPEQRMAATFILGGIIFGAYAQASGSDHLLQSKRSRLFSELTIPQEKEPLWGYNQQKNVFKRLHDFITTDKRLQSEDFELPPSVLPYLLKTHPDLKNPRDLLDKMLELRNNDGKDYREWFQKLQLAWSSGHHNEDAENAVKEVLNELNKRYPENEDENSKLVWATKIDMNFSASAKLGGEDLPIDANAKFDSKLNDIEIGVPNQIRNWIVETVLFKPHKKFLLRISMAQKNYDNLTMGLHKLWLKG